MLKLYVANTKLISNQQVFDECMTKVNEQRRAKVLRCKNEKDRYCSLLAGMLLRYGLEQEELVYPELEFSVTAEGKPVLVSVPELHFSISHSGDCAVCLLSDRPCGVDVERKERSLFEKEKRLAAVAEHILHPRERSIYQKLPQSDKREYFLRAWTRKEAVSKTAGKGLAMDFSQIEEPEERFLSFWLEEDYYLSIYVKNGIREELELCTMN